MINITDVFLTGGENIFTGVFSDDEMNDMLLTPIEQLDKALQHLAELVFKSHSKSEKCSGLNLIYFT